jgi:hypothetical protein
MIPLRDSFSDDKRGIWKHNQLLTSDWAASSAKHCKTIVACEASSAIDEQFEM